MIKTNAMRLLEQAQIPYSTREYEVDEHDLSGEHVAKQLGLDPDSVFKTLVARGDKNGIHVFCIPVREELDLKIAAAVTDNKKVELVHVKELLNLTGYIRGGCSPIAMKKEYPVTIEETAVLFDTISISAGVRGGQIVIDPEKLSEFLGASFLDVVR